jgi:hypothetical protein
VCSFGDRSSAVRTSYCWWCCRIELNLQGARILLWATFCSLGLLYRGHAQPRWPLHLVLHENSASMSQTYGVWVPKHLRIVALQLHMHMYTARLHTALADRHHCGFWYVNFTAVLQLQHVVSCEFRIIIIIMLPIKFRMEWCQRRYACCSKSQAKALRFWIQLV